MQINTILEALKSASSVVVMTGAGVSAESGIPTFRDAMEGLWAKYDPQDLATPQAFERDPDLVTRWYDERRQRVLDCAPNPGHFALAAIEQELLANGKSFTLLTQNVDGLHARAGSNNPVEVHGSITTWRCTKTGESIHDLPVPLPAYPTPSPAGGLYRPGVVWFGESLPMVALERAATALEKCDVYIAVGTSGVVFPAAGFVHEAANAGATTFELNLNRTPMTGHFDHFVEGRSGEVLPEIAKAWFGYTE